MFTHNIYHNVRVRVIVVRDGEMLIHARGPNPLGGDPFRTLPGGALDPNESLFEAGEREVYEETGLRVKVKLVAFLREWVVPKHCPAAEIRKMQDFYGVSPELTHEADYGYCLEVYLWAEVAEGHADRPRPEERGAPAEWLPLQKIDSEPLFPSELRALARDLLEGRSAVGVPSFVTGLGSPWDRPDYHAFRNVQPD